MPTHVAGEQGQQDPVRLKNLLQAAEEQLSGQWLRAAESRKLLEAARSSPSDAPFWTARSHGLAMFIAPDVLLRYRLPVKLDELVIVNRRFHVKPLLPLLSGADRFFVLALSQKRVRIFEASRDAIHQLDVAGLPTDMETALNYAGADRGLQVHSAMRGALGKQAAVFHGQGGQADSHKDDLSQYFRMIDAALQPALREESAPLLLAGVEYLLPIYREVSSYPRLAEAELVGNCDYLTDHQIHQRVWPLMAPTFQAARETAAAKYRQLAGTGKASNDLREVVAAAFEGRIDTLFVDLHSLRWGAFDPQTGRLEEHPSHQPGDDDLLDLAAVEAIVRRGTVHSVEPAQVPGGRDAAAIFRY
jgi:hypothetical protein